MFHALKLSVLATMIQDRGFSVKWVNFDLEDLEKDGIHLSDDGCLKLADMISGCLQPADGV